METMEEAQLTGQANQVIENNLSSVKIIRNSKGITWEVKVKAEDPFKAALVANEIHEGLERKYHGNTKDNI